MKISEEDRHRKEHHVARVPLKQPHQLDYFGEGEHEDQLGPDSVFAVFHVPIGCRPPAARHNERIEGKGKRREGCNVQRICAPPLLSVTKALAQASPQKQPPWTLSC